MRWLTERCSTAGGGRRVAGDGAGRRVILSLGAGVQSTALALLAARGELPLPEAAIFADTGWESAVTYAHLDWLTDRKSTRLNSSHSQISYAVFCLKKITK